MPDSIQGQDVPRVLSLNGGSSSLKFALFLVHETPKRLMTGTIGRIGESGGSAPDHEGAVAAVFERLRSSPLAAIGHRVVHGGPRYSEPQRITPEVLDELKRISPFDPDHLPSEIAIIEAALAKYPDVPQVVCFDTAFHRDLPRVAQILPIPRKYEAEGVRRYGFHGLSFASLMAELAQVGEDRGRIILAHLGNGASLSAVKAGRPMDVTMGFTSTAGLVMGTRTGDIDPGIVGYLSRMHGMSAEAFHEMANRDSGMKGISETSSDVRDLLAHQDDDVRAAEAVEVFCHSARKHIGAMVASLGGIDTLVFAGGIGENSPEIRRRICEGLEFLGISLDGENNESSAPVISTEAGRVKVHVIPADEELMIAADTIRLLQIPSAP